MKRTLTRLAVALLEYLLGFLALAVFAAVAFSAGAPTDERLIVAFKLGAVLAGVELAVLLVRAAPANRLIVGANAWLLAGGLAAFTEQWWWLKGYQHLGETSLFLSMLGVGIVATAFTPTGFVARPDPGARWFWRRWPCCWRWGWQRWCRCSSAATSNGLRCFRSLPCPGSIAWRRRP
jgi:hypothetical protein